MFEPLERKKCCGCMACVDACPKNIIGIERDEMGFAYPVLMDADACIGCDRCMRACPERVQREVDRNVGEVLCAHNRDAERRQRGSSGGIFEELARWVLDRGGVVAGAAFDAEFQVRHRMIHSVDELGLLRGSKYVQSNTAGIFRNVRENLLAGKEVLFTGTPCQASALRSFLGRDYENLYVVDLFCYGVPAPEVWAQWLRHISGGRKPVEVQFRDKTDGWDNYSLKVTFSDGSIYRRNKKKDLFLKTFPRGGYIRESCLTCRHKAFPRVSDLSIGDFQEFHQLFPGMDSGCGVSMIKVGSEKGERMLKACAEGIETTRVSASRMDGCHPGMGMPAMRHPNRSVISGNFGSMPVDRLLRRYAGMPLRQKIRFTVVKIMKRVKVYEIFRKIICRK